MKAGIDVGTTLVKVAAQQEVGMSCFSLDQFRNSQKPLQAMVQHLRSLQVNEIAIIGTGLALNKGELNYLASNFLEGVSHQGSVEAELKFQARGASRLLGRDSSSDRLIIAGVGTGVSYTVLHPDGKTEMARIGSAWGGGFIAGQGRLLGFQDYASLDKAAEEGVALDVMAEIAPFPPSDKKISVPVAHFGLVDQSSCKEDVAATIFNSVAASIVRDLLGITGTGPISGVVFVGAAVARSKMLRMFLHKYCEAFDFGAEFPENGEYATAIGALESIK